MITLSSPTPCSQPCSSHFSHKLYADVMCISYKQDVHKLYADIMSSCFLSFLLLPLQGFYTYFLCLNVLSPDTHMACSLWSLHKYHLFSGALSGNL